MRPDEAAELVKTNVSPPWDELRAARVQRRVADALARETRPARVISRARRFVWIAAVAALLGVIALIAIVRSPEPPALTRLDLADGSCALLEGSARVVPEMITNERVELRQSHGAASYDVAARPERTFVVWVRDVRVEVLGTAFRVEELAAAVRVVVTRGRVKVSRGSQSVTLVAGEEVTLRDEPPATAPSAEHDATAEPRGEESGDGAAGTSPPAPSQSGSAPAASASAEDAESRAGAAELFRRADEARGRGDTIEALRLLRELVQKHRKDGRMTLAAFTIGRLEAQRGSHAAAAAAFESCGSALQGEALAEAALAHAAAGQSGKARTLAKRYLDLFPKGARATQLSRLTE